MFSLRFSSRMLSPFHHTDNQKKCFLILTHKNIISSKKHHFLTLPSSSPKPIYQHGITTQSSPSRNPISSLPNLSPLSGVEDVVMGYILGKKRATEVAHLIFHLPFLRVWKHVVQKGDIVIDATCGNGYDTLALLKMVADESGRGCVCGMDVQEDALKSTSSWLDATANPNEKGLVKLFNLCHSKIGEIVPEGSSVRLVAFNLGYLPGGDKANITKAETTVLALEASKKILASGGLISIVAYVGHPGGREEFEAVEGFASGLSADDWTSCKFQMLNRPLAPILIFIFKK